MKLCPCGYFASEDRECHCSRAKIVQYLGRLSGPLLDRIDIQVTVNNPQISLVDARGSEVENSTDYRNRVNHCRSLQLQRQGKLNSQLSAESLLEFSNLGSRSKNTFNKAIKHYQLSIRAQQKVLRVARTIADLELSEEIKESAIMEAVSYRAFDQLLSKARNFL